MMVGHKVDLDIERVDPVTPVPLLFVKNLTCVDKYGAKTLDDVSFEVTSG